MVGNGYTYIEQSFVNIKTLYAIVKMKRFKFISPKIKSVVWQAMLVVGKEYC